MSTDTEDSLSTDPVDRLGVWKSYADVPPRYRLATYADEFRGRDVWREYAEATGALESDSERHARDYRNMVESWNEHMRERGRHPALATPEDVETWGQKLLAGEDRPTSRTRTPLSAYQPYWVGLEHFYTWLMWHADLDRYPHRYNPVIMAAAEYPDGVTGEIWAAKTDWRPTTHGEANTNKSNANPNHDD